MGGRTVNTARGGHDHGAWPRRGARRWLAAALLAGALPASAQWGIVIEHPPEVLSPIKVALAHDQQGNSLRVYRDDDSRIVALLTIHGGFTEFAPDSCPTIQIDEQAPLVVTKGEAPCELQPRTARFLLGKVEERDIRSRVLLGLINGTRIRVRYRLAGALGYREFELSLRGSRQSLYAAIGNVNVIDEAP